MTPEQLERKRTYKAAWFQANKVRIRDARAANREAIREYNREYQRKWRDENRERFRQQQTDWYRAHQDDVRAYRQANVANHRAAQALRRARKRAAVVEPFVEDDIFERDGWVCGLCREPVDPEAQHPDQMRKSLDHIIPLARGGTHTADNVQLAHLRCNIRKGGRDRQSQP